MATFILFYVLDWHKRRAKTALSDAVTDIKDSPEVKPFSFIPTQEIGHQSVAELHDISHPLGLLDGQTPSGSGNGISELPEGAGTSHHELATRNSNRLSSRERNGYPTKALNDGNESSRIRITQISNIMNLLLNPNLRWTTLIGKDGMINHRLVKQPTRDPFHTHLKVNINEVRSKQKNSSGQSVPVPPIFEAIRVRPIAQPLGRDPYAHPGAMAPGVSPIATYATIFDVEEYGDSARVSDIQLESF